MATNFIQNIDSLSTTKERALVLSLVNTALESIQPDHVITHNIQVENDILTVKDKKFDLSRFHNVFLVGFGKGSAGISQRIEEKLGEHLHGGYVIDTTPASFSKIEFTLGTHPLPSQENFQFTKHMLSKMKGLAENDLVLVVICGGGSAMLVSPNEYVTLENKIDVNKALLHSGANIIEMNTVRKHLSLVKGGQLAQHLFPATVASLIFSDVPGNDLSFIASGPTVKDTTTTQDALALIEKYELTNKIPVKPEQFTETPKDDKYFQQVINILMLSNLTALEAIQKAAANSGYTVRVLSDKIQGYADEVAQELLKTVQPGEIVIAGGETTVKVKEGGKGGRNQELVLSALTSLDDSTVICSFGTDGWDNTTFAGAIGSTQTVEAAQKKDLSIHDYWDTNNSTPFFEEIGDGILTNRLPSNVADLMIVLKKKKE